MKDRILEIIKHEHLTNAEFANRLNVSPSTISSVLTGRNKASLDVISKIHQVFHINLEWLLYGTGEAKSEPGGKTGYSMPGLFDENPANPSNEADASENRKEIAPRPLEKGTNNVVKQDVAPVLPPPRKITEIRIFFDDNTFETFKPGK